MEHISFQCYTQPTVRAGSLSSVLKQSGGCWLCCSYMVSAQASRSFMSSSSSSFFAEIRVQCASQYNIWICFLPLDGLLINKIQKASLSKCITKGFFFFFFKNYCILMFFKCLKHSNKYCYSDQGNGLQKGCFFSSSTTACSREGTQSCVAMKGICWYEMVLIKLSW